MIRPRRQIELAHRRTHEALTFFREFAELPNFPNPHIGVANHGKAKFGNFAFPTSGDVGLRIAFVEYPMPLAREYTQMTPHSIANQLFVIYARHFDVNVNSVKNRT